MSDDKKTMARNMLKKIIANIKQDSQFLKDVMVDETGLKKIETQISESHSQLEGVKAKMTVLLQKELQSTRKLKILRHRMAEEESQVIAALNDNDEQQAFALATDLAATELEYQNQLKLDESFTLNVESLQTEMEYAERHQKELERQLSMVDTTKRIQQASEVIVQSLNQVGNQQLSARQSLQKIRERQQRREQNQRGGDVIKHDDAPEKGLDKSFELESAADVLKRLQDKSNQS